MNEGEETFDDVIREMLDARLDDADRDWCRRLRAAHEREVARFKAALKPVLECPRICFIDIVNGNSRDAINAVINAKRIYNEGEEK